MSELRTIVIDGREAEVEPDFTLIQACEQEGIEIPRFCYHERLSIAGNCRMCLVEVVGGPPKPTASCAMQVKDLRPGRDGSPPQIRTNSPMVKKAREGVMEFLLINHPLDCPICDQGGECDLQDQAMAYGVDFSRFREAKRAVDDLDLGPLVETHMTRCISCTRCVRFTTEVAGIHQMGQTGRGEDAEITSYLNQSLNSNLQGNIIDLCPVGALTSKPYAFTARPWELTKTETIDVMDALGSNIRVDTKGREVMRIIPRNHDGVNEEWISDKARFVWDGLRNQRIDRPYLREDGRLRPVDWGRALEVAAEKIRSGRLAALAGDLVPVEPIYALGRMVRELGGSTESRTDGAALPPGNRSAYVGNARIEDIDRAGRIVIIGSNPRNEAPVLNARIRRAWIDGAEVVRFGKPADLTFDHVHGGSDFESFERFADESGLRSEGDELLIVGQAAISGRDGEAVLAKAMQLASAGLGMLVLHTAAARVGAMDVGFTSEGGIESALADVDTIYNLGADEIEIRQGPFVIYQGSHGDRGAHRADLVLPSAACTEEAGIFVNTEGRPQFAARASFPPGMARENWAVVRALAGMLGSRTGYDSLAELRRALAEEFPHLHARESDQVPENDWMPLPEAPMPSGPIGESISDFYLTNPVARSSPLMAELSALASGRQTEQLHAAE